MGQYPSPYESGPYSTAPQNPHEVPYAAGSPAYGPGGMPPNDSMYGPGGAPYGPGGGPYVPGMPVPMVIIRPPDPEELAEKSRRTTRGLGLGAVITGTVSVVIQVLVVLGIILIISASGSSSDATLVLGFIVILTGFFIVPMLVFAAWATSFGLALAACVRANSGWTSLQQPAHWAGAGGVMGGLLAASILQGAPFVMLFFAAGLYGDSASSGNAMLVMTAITGLGLLFAHIVLIIKVRGLGLQIEKQVPYAQVPYS